MTIPELKGVLSNEVRHAQMQTAIERGFPFLKKRALFSDERVSIACYGPSLKTAWHGLRLPVITVSGAHDFLIERELLPEWHVEIDPRPNKAAMLTPHPDVQYLMASVCHPDVWDRLKGHKVQLWHLINDAATVEWVKKNDHEHIDSMIGGNSTAGQRALNVGAALGFRKFDIYGMDCSFEEEQHAGPHTGIPEKQLRVLANKRVFNTTPQMHQAAREMVQFLETYDVEVAFHGDGLMQELAKGLQRKVNA